MNKILNAISEFFKSKSGGAKGALIGLVVALLIIFLGLIKTIFIAICVGIGYYIGKCFEADKNFFRKLLDRFLPPGRFR